MSTLLEVGPHEADAKNESKSAKAWRAYQVSGACVSAEEELLKVHLPLVRSVVDRMAASLPSHVEVDDLYSVGITGLIRAVRKYDPTQGASFAGYAAMRIRGSILDELRRMDWMSRGVRTKAKRLTDVIQELEQRLGRGATEGEIAEELSLSAGQYAELLDEVKPISYIELDAPSAEDDDEPSLHEAIADDTQPNASKALEKKEAVQLLTARIQRLPDTQRKVLAMYYFENLRLAEIAEVFGVTESRICQIHSQAVLSLRTYLTAAIER